MRFQVPQFIEREAKVVGPLTFRQFVYLGIPGAFAFFLYFLAPFTVFLFGSLILGVIGFSLAFVKVGGKPIVSLLLSMLSFKVRPQTYIWRKTDVVQKKAEAQYAQPKEAPISQIALTKQSKVKDLAVKIKTQS